MAHKKGVGSTDNGRDSNSNRLGVKIYGGQTAIPGNIIVRQRGTKFHPGQNVYMGRDHTIHAAIEGVVTFTRKRNNRTFINIMPVDEVADVVAKPVVKAAPKAKPAPKKAAPTPKAEAEKAAPAPKVEVEELSAEQKEANKSELLGTLGQASEADKDDLKKIKGVGPKLEGVLNSIGVYTFSQVSKMTEKEYDLVDSLIDSFKGRAKRDDWAAQAKDLM